MQRFLKQAGSGQIVLDVCPQCRNVQLPVLPGCRRCGHDQLDMQMASGRATVRSWTRVEHRFAATSPTTPYVTAVLEMEEGPRVLGLLRDGTAEPAIGDHVRLVAGNDGKPVFQPDANPAGSL